MVVAGTIALVFRAGQVAVVAPPTTPVRATLLLLPLHRAIAEASVAVISEETTQAVVAVVQEALEQLVLQMRAEMVGMVFSLQSQV